MAKIVLAAATSHTPMVAMHADDWADYARGDRRNGGLYDVDGEHRSFDELATRYGDRYTAVINPDRFHERERTVIQSLDRLAEAFERAKPDVVVIVGDDQNELFGPDGQPAMAIYWGDAIEMGPREGREAMLGDRYPDGIPNWVHDVAVGHGFDQPHSFPCSPEMGRHLLKSLVGDGFDISSMRGMPPERKFGHAFGFIIHRFLGDGTVPVVPVLLNTFYEPNQPSPARCYALGKALRAAVESYPGDLRVAIVASGGLSHFVVDEELDRQVLEAIEKKDAHTLASLPQHRLNSGTSEVRNWITVAAAAENLPVSWSAYEPAVRTPAGTGCGLAFVQWA